MSWLLKFIPFNSIISYICSFLKKNWTSKTDNPFDDAVIDKILEPTLLHWKDYALDPNADLQTALLGNASFIVDFLDDVGLNILSVHLKEKQKERSKLEKVENDII